MSEVHSDEQAAPETPFWRLKPRDRFDSERPSGASEFDAVVIGLWLSDVNAPTTATDERLPPAITSSGFARRS